MTLPLDFLRAQSKHYRALINLMETALKAIATSDGITLSDARQMAKVSIDRATAFRDSNNVEVMRPEIANRDHALILAAERLWGGA